MKYKVAFVILNYNNYQDTIALVRSVNSQVWSSVTKVYVVDNNSINDSLQKLYELAIEIDFKLIESKKNLGFARGNNLGISSAIDDGFGFVVCANSDTILEKDSFFLDTLFKVFEEKEKVAIIAPNIINQEGSFQNPFKIKRFSIIEIIKFKLFYITNLYKLYYFLRVNIFYRIITYFAKKRKLSLLEISKSNSTSQYIYAPHGSFIIFTPLFFKYYKGLDNNTFLFCEEYILAEMLHKKGLKCWFETNLKVVHNESKSIDYLGMSYKEKVKFTLKHTFKSCKYFSKLIKF